MQKILEAPQLEAKPESRPEAKLEVKPEKKKEENQKAKMEKSPPREAPKPMTGMAGLVVSKKPEAKKPERESSIDLL